ncbi:MAG: glycoside hydrolase family 3 C-terminal domain-containing protein [Clostridia bacterium]|nr:glycoside hydrolase family 3 C-terminal domain-containing protein [Clostridia bacterium]MBR2414317.1 glycoside hydrolase family 3 C-terminal domain-containing protein [Clostridia bacterium]
MKDPREILAQMNLEEKAALLDGADFWHMQGMEKYDIPSVTVCDGPHGLRKKDYSKKGISLSTSVPAISYPTAVTTACSWDPELLFEMGTALGKKCLKEEVGVLLGPGINMKRSPLCGRNFEYFSEDPVLAGEVAAGFINGVQSMGVGTSLKHFCANSQETRRMTCDSVVDERALREIYLTGFEIAVKKGKPWTVMNSYNKINGDHGSENKHTQIEILRDTWGFDGVVVSDWGAVNDRVKGLANGNDLEMPSSTGSGAAKIVAAVKDGTLDERIVNERALNVLKLIKKCADGAQPNYAYNDLDDQAFAKKVAAQSMVLLKNNGILPLDKSKKIAVIGELARTPRYQGAGSSHINPTQLDNALDEFKKAGWTVDFAQGYELKAKKAKKNEAHLQTAIDVAKKNDIAVVFIGLTDDYEAEGYDREHMNLPEAHDKLVKEILKVNPNTVIVLSGGSPVEMPWNDSVSAVLNAYLGGQAGAGAIVDILTGAVNPCGKLAETYPMTYADTPAKNNYPGNPASVEYRESIYIGYRYYEKANKRVRYPFGHGLSYTTFEYSDLTLDKSSMDENDTLTVTFTVKNTGDVAGAEIAQLYVADRESTIYRPVKELKGFKKIWLEAGEEKQITLTLGKRAFAFFNVLVNDWCVESGAFDILVGASSADIRLVGTVNVNANDIAAPDYRMLAPCYYTGDVQNVPEKQFVAVLGRELPPTEKSKNRKLDLNDTFESANYTKNGKRLFAILTALIPAGMARAIAVQTPFRNFISMSGGVFSENMAEGLLRILSGEKGGIRMILKGIPGAIKGIGPLLSNI